MAGWPNYLFAPPTGGARGIVALPGQPEAPAGVLPVPEPPRGLLGGFGASPFFGALRDHSAALTAAGFGMLFAPNAEAASQAFNQGLQSGQQVDFARSESRAKREREAKQQAAYDKLAAQLGLPAGLPENIASPLITNALKPKDPESLVNAGDGRLYDPNTKQWITAPDAGTRGPFEGNGMDAQSWNIILKGDPNSPEYAAAYNQLFEQPKTQLAPTPQGLVPVTVMPQVPPSVRPPAGRTASPTAAGQPGQTAQGTPGVAIPGTQPAATEGQANAHDFATRMEFAAPTVDKLEKVGTDYWQWLAAQSPLGLGNVVITPEYRQFQRAKDDFVRAALRKESGALISKEDQEYADRTWIPQPGDDPQTLADKREARRIVARSIRETSGPFSNQQLAPAQSAPPAAAVEYLKQHPDLRGDFDAKYGQGAAAKVLGN